MAKKNFSEGLDSLFGGSSSAKTSVSKAKVTKSSTQKTSEKKAKPSPKKTAQPAKTSAKQPKPLPELKFSKATEKKLEAVAFWENTTVESVIHEAVNFYLDFKIDIKPIPSIKPKEKNAPDTESSNEPDEPTA